MQVCWEYLTPPEFKRLAKEEKVCILPIGSLERHGEHLPYGTDALVAHDLAVRAANIEPAVVFPTYYFGQVHEAAAFAGSINFPTPFLLELLQNLLDQIAHNGFKKILIYNGHGGNQHFLDYFAMSQMDRKVDYTLYIYRGMGEHEKALGNIYDTTPGHAAESETSDVLAVVPDGVVKMDQQCYAEPILPKYDLKKELPNVHSGFWWYAMYPENVSESPSHASKEKGEMLLNARAQDIAEVIRLVKKDTLLPQLQQEYYDRWEKVRDNV